MSHRRCKKYKRWPLDNCIWIKLNFLSKLVYGPDQFKLTKNSLKKPRREERSFQAMKTKCLLNPLMPGGNKSSYVLKDVLKIRSKFTGKHACRSVIVIICKATLLKSHFGLGVPLEICCIFSEQLFLRTLPVGYLWSKIVIKERHEYIPILLFPTICISFPCMETVFNSSRIAGL